MLAEPLDGVVYRFDFIRSANPGQGHAGGVPVWAAEFQGGPVSQGFHKGRVPSPDDMRRWMLAAVGSGVTAISFWVTRAEIMFYEQNGFSLLDSTGETTPRLEETGRVGRVLNAHADLFGQPTLQPAQVGIVVGETNAQFSARLANGSEHLDYSLRGWHRLLWELNVPLDFLDVDHDLDRAAEYDALVLPFPLVLSDDTATKLARYVEGGGSLISEAAPGRIDENGFCVRGEMSPVLADLFDARQTRFTMVREPDGGERWSPAERTWGEYLDATELEGAGPLEGHRLQANVYLQTFACGRESEAVLLAGEAVAGVRRHVGQGQAWLLGTYIGHNGSAYRSPEVHAGVKAILGACGVEPQHDGQFVLRKRVLPDKEAWIITNPTPEARTEAFPVAGWENVQDPLGDAVSREGDTVVLTVEGLDTRVVIMSGKAAVS